ncbi:MAG TPA: hypothetical protein VN493_21340 [Thermoanaerobaculia bacterium]|nr:hypothetical protein [Thermoanaerobaculia bacterium]
MITARFKPLGRTLLLETDSAAILAIAEDTFGRFGPAGIVDAPDVTVRLLDVPPPALDNPAAFRSHVLLFELLSQLWKHGLMAVHGSALVKDGRAILLRGPSGSGKTTLAYAGARSRFQALAEDVVWVDLETGRWRGMPWLFHLLPDAARLFPELAGLPPVLESAGKIKLEVDLDRIRPGSTVTEARPGPVVLLERAPVSILEPLGPAEAREIWRRCPAGLEESFPGYDRHVEELLQDGAWRLRLGTNLEEALDLLETLPG